MFSEECILLIDELMALAKKHGLDTDHNSQDLVAGIEIMINEMAERERRLEELQIRLERIKEAARKGN